MGDCIATHTCPRLKPPSLGGAQRAVNTCQPIDSSRICNDPVNRLSLIHIYIRQAEQQLIAANAQIGVAKAAFFPAISLTGFFGASSTDLSDLFNGPQRAWQFAGQLAQPIFTGGSLTGQLQAAEAVQQEALFNYCLLYTSRCV